MGKSREMNTDKFFDAIGLDPDDRAGVLSFSKRSGVPTNRLRYYNENNILPTGNDLSSVLSCAEITAVILSLKMGLIDTDLLRAIQQNSEAIEKIIDYKEPVRKGTDPKLEYTTKLGKLYQSDCLDLMREMDNESVDLIFADPPFNLKKLYPSEIDDNLKESQYLEWCEKWIMECARVLKHGGAFYSWNLPKWNTICSNMLNSRLKFMHWIAVDIKYTLPIQSRFYPSHYSLLYFIKGTKANTFSPDRLPMQTCPKCFGDLKDYGGYKNKMNPLGVNISDVWIDIHPVRHAKYKRRGANELPLKLLDRVIETSTKEGDIVFDPFGGSGTTYMAAELKNRKWIGSEIGPLDDIVKRFSDIDTERELLNKHRENINVLFTERVYKNRVKKGLWTCDSVAEAAPALYQDTLL